MTLHRCEFDVQHFPLVLVRSPAVIDEDGIRDMFARFDELYRAKKRYAAVIDSTRTRELPTPKLRKVLTDLTEASTADARRWCVGTAMVVNSSIVRGLLTAVAWVVQSPTPTVHVATPREAVNWCRARLETAGIGLSPETQRYAEQLR